MSDLDLIREICSGSQDALLHLVVDRCGASLRHLAKKFGYDGDLPHDLCVHLFGNGDWSRLKSWQAVGSLEGWVGRVARHLCIDQKRNRMKYEGRFERLQYEDVTAKVDGGGTQQLIAEETRTRTLQAVEMMNPRDRTIILLHCLGSMTISELAAHLGEDESVVRVAKSRALARLRGRLHDEGADDV